MQHRLAKDQAGRSALCSCLQAARICLADVDEDSSGHVKVYDDIGIMILSLPFWQNPWNDLVVEQHIAIARAW